VFIKPFISDGDVEDEDQAKFTTKGGGQRHHTDLTVR
jgi:hypothetical protein